MSASHGVPLQTSIPGARQVNLASSCKPEKIHNIFSLFEYEKAKLLRESGFGGLLYMPCLELNLDLCLWLLRRFDFKNRCLHLPGGVDLPVRLQDVYLVLGIPYEGRPLLFDLYQSKEKISAFLESLFGGTTSSCLTLPFLESILQKEYDLHMTDPEKDAFTIATWLYSTAYLLAPEAHDEFPTKLVQNILVNIRSLRINWATLVLCTLHRASIDAVEKLASGCNNITIFGCCLFLQVFYIDNLKFGTHHPNHSILPRTSNYFPELMSDLILSDRSYTSDENLTQFGKTEVSPDYAVGYTRAWMDELDQPSQDLWCIEFISESFMLVDKVSVPQIKVPSHTNPESVTEDIVPSSSIVSMVADGEDNRTNNPV